MIYHISLETRNAQRRKYLLLPLENPSTDSSQMNIRSAPCHKKSTCRISSPYDKAFDISCLQNSEEKTAKTLWSLRGTIIICSLSNPISICRQSVLPAPLTTPMFQLFKNQSQETSISSLGSKSRHIDKGAADLFHRILFTDENKERHFTAQPMAVSVIYTACSMQS
jgi:hypothetical protein